MKTSPNPSERLECLGLRKTFGVGRPILDGIDLQVPPGKALVLLGSSGAGKTTLLRIIAGLEQADAGRVTLGERVLSDPACRIQPEQRRIGMVFQALELWPHMTVAEHIAFGLPGRPRGRHAIRHVDVRTLAEQVGLAAGLLERGPATLSGGEQQRVAIARTLAAQPQVILYDEPLANLDPDRRRALRALIRRLAREHGTTLVYVTHDPEEALEIGDELAVLADGKVVERGAPQDLYRAPQSLIGARALGPVTALPAAWNSGRVETALGALTPVAQAACADGETCLALVRPESIVTTNEGGTPVRVSDVVARGPDWAFTAEVEGGPLHGRSEQYIQPGDVVNVCVRGAVAVLPAERLVETLR